MKGKKLKIFLSVIFITFAFMVSLTLTQGGSTIIVPGDYSTIQEAIYAAGDGDTVYVSAGTYSLTTNGEVFPIYMSNGVSLVGEGADVCILDAGRISNVIVCNYITNTSTKIEGFTIRNGSGELGAGIYCSWSSSPTIANNIITGNRASKGGGIYCFFASSPSIISNVIAGNSASINGGGIYCEFYSSPTITNNVITGNEASGELWEGAGGGIYCINSSSPSIINNVITGNSAFINGGGIYCFNSSSPTITNNIITGNTSNSGGGGIHCDDSSFPSITYDDVWGNVPLDYWDCVEGTGSISEDPLFVDPTVSDYSLSADSPCIDTGDTEVPGLPDFDLDGNPRIVDGDGDGAAVVDMGAFEYQGVLAIEATIDIDPDTLNLKNKGNWVTAYIELPAGYNVADIDVSTLWLNDSVKAEAKPASIGDNDNDGIVDLMAKFDRPAVEDLLEVSEKVEITVSGSLINGTQFVGIDIIRVISKGKK